MKYSVIIPVYNRPDEVNELLESLTLQTCKDFEVVVVEDGPFPAKKSWRNIVTDWTSTTTTNRTPVLDKPVITALNEAMANISSYWILTVSCHLVTSKLLKKNCNLLPSMLLEAPIVPTPLLQTFKKPSIIR